MALITTSEYKAYAGISDTSFDSFLNVAIPAAQKIIERICGRPYGGFESASQTEFWDGSETRCYYVKCWPITAVTGVYEVDSDGTTTEIDSTSYVVSPDTKAICRSGSRMVAIGAGLNDVDRAFAVNQTGIYPQFVEGCKNYKVVYTGGFTTVPDDLKWACYRVVDDMVSNRRQPTNIKSESIGDYSYTKGIGPQTLVEVKSILADFMVDIA